MKESEILYKDDVVEYHDFMMEDESTTFVPPAVMRGYVPGKSYIPTGRWDKLRVVANEVTAISFGLAAGAVYSVFAFFGFSK